MKKDLLPDGGERKEKPRNCIVGVYTQADVDAGVGLGEKILEERLIYADKCLERCIVPMWVVALDDKLQRSLADFGEKELGK